MCLEVNVFVMLSSHCVIRQMAAHITVSNGLHLSGCFDG